MLVAWGICLLAVLQFWTTSLSWIICKHFNFKLILVDLHFILNDRVSTFFFIQLLREGETFESGAETSNGVMCSQLKTRPCKANKENVNGFGSWKSGAPNSTPDELIEILLLGTIELRNEGNYNFSSFFLLGYGHWDREASSLLKIDQMYNHRARWTVRETRQRRSTRTPIFRHYFAIFSHGHSSHARATCFQRWACCFGQSESLPR